MVARELFSQYGYQKTTMDDIARKLHKGKSSLYYYFKSKDEVFESVIEYEASLLRKKLAKALEKARTPMDKIKIHSVTRMEIIRDLVNFYEALKNDYLNHLPFIEKVRAKYDKEETEALKAILLEGVEQGYFEIEDPDLYARAMTLALKGIEIPLFVQPETKQDSEKIIQSLLNILYYGIMKKS